MNHKLLDTINITGYVPVGYGNDRVYNMAEQFIKSLSLSSVPHDQINYLARPVLHSDGSTIDWEIPFDSKKADGSYMKVKWTAATPEERAAALSKLNEFERNLIIAANESRRTKEDTLFVSFLSGDQSSRKLNAIHFPGKEYVYIVDGLPVVTMWGFLKDNNNTEVLPFNRLKEVVPNYTGGAYFTPPPRPEAPVPPAAPVAEAAPAAAAAAPAQEPVQQGSACTRHRCCAPFLAGGIFAGHTLCWLIFFLLLLLLLIPLLIWLLWKYFGLFAGLLNPWFGAPDLPAPDLNPPGIEAPLDPAQDKVAEEPPAEEPLPEEPLGNAGSSVPAAGLNGGGIGGSAGGPGAGGAGGVGAPGAGGAGGVGAPGAGGAGDVGAPGAGGASDVGAPGAGGAGGVGAPGAGGAGDVGAPGAGGAGDAGAPGSGGAGDAGAAAPGRLPPPDPAMPAQQDTAAAKAAERQAAIDAARAAEEQALNPNAARKPVAPPDPVMPSGAQSLSFDKQELQSKGVSVLNGDWNTRSPLMDSANGKPLQMAYKFNDGKGEITVTRPNGAKCTAPITAALKGQDVVIENGGKAVCPDNSTYQLPQVKCTPDTNGKVNCTGQNGNQRFPITLFSK